VYQVLGTPEGRRRFWAESAEEQEGAIEFIFADGTMLRSRILAADPPGEYRLTYFNESVVTFLLMDDEAGGTDLVLTEEGLGEDDWKENLPGWVSVLLHLKAAVDHGVDLRSHDPGRTWQRGYVDA
jgi:hypothetical protein